MLMRGRVQSTTFHSRLVAFLKVALPLLALAILSTLFLVSRSVDPSDAIPYAEVDVAERIREPRMTDPTYSGVTRDGASFTLRAGSARPTDAAGNATAEGLLATLVTPDGETTRLVAAQASIDSAAGTVGLTGGVRIEAAQGYVIETQSLRAALDRTELASDGRISGIGPMGRFEAGRLVLKQSGADGRYVLLFSDGVKMIYTPQGN
jgi:lipopolysaccharide export system protein LptC